MKQIFYDPDRKRWKRLRRVMDIVAVSSTVILILFFLNVVRRQTLPELLLPASCRATAGAAAHASPSVGDSVQRR
jgi:peptidoglycan-N-acetylglucosamine deacetylase